MTFEQKFRYYTNIVHKMGSRIPKQMELTVQPAPVANIIELDIIIV